MRTLEIMKCLSDLTRARVVHLLAQRGPELCVCEIVAALDLPQSTVSRQLMTLRYLGLVQDRREGVWMHYSIAPASTPGHRLVLELLRKGFDEEPVFSDDVERFDKLTRRRPIAACEKARRAARAARRN
jgi:ArsR family transcriptional regulator, arsenate/arsenite/antimonite-responsive transcriptional repressor